ncbi:MAG: DUF507 family protein [Nitrospirae bacterium]|nr:DUF507 family protein [Nitrospirota bacterium]
MILSEEKVSALSHQILENVIEKKWAALLEDETRVLRDIKKAISSELKISEEIDLMVRNKIHSYSRTILRSRAGIWTNHCFFSKIF